MAVAEFGRVDEAAKVFRAVAYRWLGNSVIYLEKGPSGMFTEDAGSIEARTVFSSSALPAVKVPEQMAEDIADQDEEPPSVAGGSTLYVKNISFATTEQRFENVFRNLPSFSFARIQTKPDPKRPDGRWVWDTVSLKDAEGAKRALKGIHGFFLDGHALRVGGESRKMKKARPAS
jgi:multiple RNA-binding domain-containing protein 1